MWTSSLCRSQAVARDAGEAGGGRVVLLAGGSEGPPGAGPVPSDSTGDGPASSQVGRQLFVPPPTRCPAAPRDAVPTLDQRRGFPLPVLRAWGGCLAHIAPAERWRPADTGAEPGSESLLLGGCLPLQSDRLGKYIKYQLRINATKNSIILHLSSKEMPHGAGK